LPDDQELVLADQESPHADGDRQARDVRRHGRPQPLRRDGFLSPASFHGTAGFDASQGHLHPRPVPAEDLAARQLRRFSRRWSPNGKRIAFLSNRDGDRDNVFVVDTQGGEAKQLTNVDDIVTEIAWRPDGKSIAFSAGVGLHDYVGLVDLNGRMEKIVDFPESESSIGGDAGPPAPWSADGANLAFVSNVHDHLDIGVLDLRRRRVRWLVQSKWYKSRPLWSPDGKRIAFLENRDGNIQLKTISAAGGGARAVSSTKVSASHAAWHPTGQG